MLERYVLGELPGEEMKHVDELVKHDKVLQEQAEAIRISNKDILEKYTPEKMARDIELKLHTKQVSESLNRQSQKSTLLDIFMRKPAFATVLTILVLIGITPVLYTMLQDNRGQEITRIKGLSPHLAIHRRTEKGSEQLNNLDSANRGDVIQISYVSAGKAHGVILSIDGRGAVTLHFPTTESASTELQEEGEILLESAYELDDAPLFEHFIFITADETIKVGDVLKAGKKLAVQLQTGESDTLLDLPKKWQQYSIVLRKGKS